MGIKQPKNLTERVHKAAAIALKHNRSVGPLDLLQEMSFLYCDHVEQWKKGHPMYEYICEHIECGDKKLEQTFAIFKAWTESEGLKPVRGQFLASSRAGGNLKFTHADTPEIVEFYSTHFVSGDASEADVKRATKKLNKAPELNVFELTRDDAECVECHAVTRPGGIILLESKQPICLNCADMDHLAFLPKGDATLTRRAKKASPLSAVVLRFNHRRKHYDRIGILVTIEAIDEAKLSMIKDADERSAMRAKAAERRVVEDFEYVTALTGAILDRYPGCDPEEAAGIAEFAGQRGSGRVGRSVAAKELDPAAIDLAVRAWVRHRHTDYDNLLMRGVERSEARARIESTILQVLSRWGEQ